MTNQKYKDEIFQLQIFCDEFLKSIAERKKKLVMLKIYAVAIVQKSIM